MTDDPRPGRRRLTVTQLVIGSALSSWLLFGIVAVDEYLDDRRDRREEARDDTEADQRRMSACLSSRENAQAINLNTLDQADAVRSTIDFLSDLLGAADNPESPSVVRANAFIAEQEAILHRIEGRLQPVRICTPDAIDAFGRGDFDDAFEPTTVPTTSEPPP